MGLFGTNTQESSRAYFNLYDGGNVDNGGEKFPNVEINSPRTFNEFKINLEPHNGKVHTILLYAKMTTMPLRWKADSDYAKMEQFISLMQDDGYEILDLRMTQLKEKEYWCMVNILYK